MPKIYLRTGQKPEDRFNAEYLDDQVEIYAPEWVKESLATVHGWLKGKQFDIYAGDELIDSFVIGDAELTLPQLVMIARNETFNVTGVIDTTLFEGLTEKQIWTIKDLVKQCVIVGKDQAEYYGGYPSNMPLQKFDQPKEVLLCDLSGLQFQQKYNSGRLVLIGEDISQGELDEEIFANVVGRKKKSVAECAESTDSYVKIPNYFGKAVYFDTQAYQAFVKQDFILSAIAQNQLAQQENKAINFKFLQYGAGFFAEVWGCPDASAEIKRLISKHIFEGIYQGLETLLGQPGQCSQIKSIELPFYNENNNADAVNKIKALCQVNNIAFAITKEDALFSSDKNTTATTTNTDPHATKGNEMGRRSVDAAIAENIKSKSNKFSPAINLKFGVKTGVFIDVNKPVDEEELKKKQAASYDQGKYNAVQKYELFKQAKSRLIYNEYIEKLKTYKAYRSKRKLFLFYDCFSNDLNKRTAFIDKLVARLEKGEKINLIKRLIEENKEKFPSGFFSDKKNPDRTLEGILLAFKSALDNQPDYSYDYDEISGELIFLEKSQDGHRAAQVGFMQLKGGNR